MKRRGFAAGCRDGPPFAALIRDDLVGYDLHITRAEYHFKNEGRWITAEEWLALVDADPELRLAGYNGEYFALWSGKSQWPDPWLNWFDGNISTKNPDDPLIDKMVEIARQFDAQVQGDDGEIYLGGGQWRPAARESTPGPLDIVGRLIAGPLFVMIGLAMLVGLFLLARLPTHDIYGAAAMVIGVEAYSIVAILFMLLGLRYILGPQSWIDRLADKFTGRILGFAAMAGVIVGVLWLVAAL